MGAFPNLTTCHQCGEPVEPPQEHTSTSCPSCHAVQPLVAWFNADEYDALLAALPFNRSRLCLVAIVEQWRAEVILIMADDATLRVPFAAFAPSGTGLAPDWTQPAIRDHGQTLALGAGAYEADIDALGE